MRDRARDAVAWAGRTAAFHALVEVLHRMLPAEPGTLAVLTYHRVDLPARRPWLYPGLISATPDEFRRQLEWVGSRLRPVSIDEVLDARRSGRRLPPRAVLITFDDAYRDVEEHAWPTLVRLGIPATLFVPTAAAEDDWPGFWWDRVHQAVLVAGSRGVAAIESPVGQLAVATSGDRGRATRQLLDGLKVMDHDQAMAAVASLTAAGDAGATAPPERSTLTWPQLQALAQQGLRLAPHTHTHPLLPRIPSDRIRSELETSRAELRRHVSSGLRSVLAYPSGAYDDRSVDVVRELGFELAFTTRRGVVPPTVPDPLRLRRINVGARTTPALIEAQMVAASAARRRRLARPRQRGGSWSG